MSSDDRELVAELEADCLHLTDKPDVMACTWSHFKRDIQQDKASTHEPFEAQQQLYFARMGEGEWLYATNLSDLLSEFREIYLEE